MKIIVGKAKYEDVFDIVALLESGRQEVSYELPPAEIPYCYVKLMEFISAGYCWVVKLENGAVVGTIIIEPHGLWYRTRAHYLENCEFYVSPMYRKGRTAEKLVEKAKEAADGAAIGGIPLILSLRSGTMAEEKDRFVQTLGFRYVGGSLIYEQSSLDKPEESASPELKEAV